MINKDANFKWTTTKKENIEKIKTMIVNACVLRSLDFNIDFILYTFAFDLSLAVILIQKTKGNGCPISFILRIHIKMLVCHHAIHTLFIQ